MQRKVNYLNVNVDLKQTILFLGAYTQIPVPINPKHSNMTTKTSIDFIEEQEFIKRYFQHFLVDELEPDEIFEALKAYAQQKCKEQREICAKAFMNAETIVEGDQIEVDREQIQVDHKAILNAPSPPK